MFQILKIIPKGGVLHIHDFGITSVDWLIKNITYRDNLWYTNTEWCAKFNSPQFRWFKTTPVQTKNCVWYNLKQLRNTLGPKLMDQMLQDHLTIITDDPAKTYPNINVVWSKFQSIFGILIPLLSYEPVARDYFYQGFKEFKDDQVQYFEFRATLPSFCREMHNISTGECNDETTSIETASILQEVSNQFIRDHPNDFCGIRMIYAPFRGVSIDTLEDYLETMFELENQIGGGDEFVAGFDLVGQEDKGKPLIDFAEVILNMTKDHPIKMFYHAGETDWQGQTTDLNLFDALLLNTSRHSALKSAKLMCKKFVKSHIPFLKELSKKSQFY